MTISIITPYKDSARWLPVCVNSLMVQPGDFEFILVNDGSKDNGPEIVEGFALIDERIRPFENERAPGVSGARNTGLDNARGDYITFLDADDELRPDAWEIFENATRLGEDIVQFNHLRYYSKTNKNAMKYTNEGGPFIFPNVPVHWFGVWNKLFRAEFLEDIRFNEALQYGEDGYFVLECLRKCGRIYHAPKASTTVTHRFVNKSSLSKSKTLNDVTKQTTEYFRLLDPEGDPAFNRFVCMELARLWTAVTKWFNY